MLRLLAIFSNSSSEDSANKKAKEKKTQSKKEAEEAIKEQPEVKRKNEQNVQCDEKKSKSKKKPQVNDPPSGEGKDTKVKKKKSHDRDSGLGEMIDNDDFHPPGFNREATTHRRHKKIPQYGYFDSELDGVFPNGDRSRGHVARLSHPPKSRAGHLSGCSNVPTISSPSLVTNKSSASFDNGTRARQHLSLSAKNQHCDVVSNGELGCWEESYNNHEARNLGVPPFSTPAMPNSRARNLSLNSIPRSDPFTRSAPPPRRASDGAVLSSTKLQSEKGKKTMKLSEYHKYQEEKIAAQYHRYRVNPLPISDESEVIPARPGTPTLIQIQHEYKSLNVQGSSLRRISMTESNSGFARNSQPPIIGRPEQRRNHSETTIMQQQLNVPRAPQPRRNTPSCLPTQFHNSVTSLSSSSSTSGSGGPPTPTSKRSSVNIIGSRPGTPSMNEKDKRKRSTLGYC
ncbi:455_t:CDS:2 [Acaulospora colombiana]|uniref:455_t:CDS:1 n=1 Tax=Acaulospora colombiana TaxID=27376 RepID=A0ACA9LSW5_9GLOM|nr:455_t:CDS:2 [Acaulospora colombiana]